MFIVYSPQISPRIEYVVNTIFTTILHFDVEITDDFNVFDKSSAIRINYSRKPAAKSIQIIPTKLLLTQDIISEVYDFGIWYNLPSFFHTDPTKPIPFDLFAAVFFLLTRMEEYNATDFDEHQRFDYKSSIAYQNDFLEQPLVDQWCYKLMDIVREIYPNCPQPPRSFKHISTVDVDNAYAFREKGMIRNILGAIKSLFSLRFKDIALRLGVLTNGVRDPFDNYQFIRENQQFAHSAIFFFPVGKRSKLDRHLSYRNSAYRKLIKEIAGKADVGLHPTYNGGNDVQSLINEHERLTQITEKSIVKARYHFLRFTLPCSYRQLINVGITEDYSMGYAKQVGFRASTCTPYPFYDLEEERTTSLIIFPLPLMDSTLNMHLKLYPDVAKQKIAEMVDIIREVDGTFISLWHNESVGDYGNWRNWSSVFTFTMQKAHSNERETQQSNYSTQK